MDASDAARDPRAVRYCACGECPADPLRWMCETNPGFRLEPFAAWEIEPTRCDRCGKRLNALGTVAVLLHDDVHGDRKADVVWCLPCAQEAAPKEAGARG
jgi:hypothetical protein